jgi:Flp pilus assembly protein TadD
MLLSKDPKRLDEALAFAKQAAEIMPNEPNVLDTYGMVLMMKGQLGEAEKVLNRSLDIQATPASRLNLGAVHEKLGRKSDALRQYQLGWELIKNSPSDPYYRELQEALKRLSK